MPLRLVIVTPTGSLVDADVESAVCPGAEGEFGVLPGHEALLAALQQGTVEYRLASGEKHQIQLSGGFAEVTQERITLLGTPVD